MFLGHFALGFSAKRADPRVSLGTYFLAAQLPDVIWPGLVLGGLERVSIVPGDTRFTPLRFDSYPYSHSLLTVVLWAGLAAGLHYLLKRRSRSAGLIGLLVLSHWLLDWVSHRPDLPLFPGSPLVGLGLWKSVPATLIVESAMFTGGVLLYAGATVPRDRTGQYGFMGLVGFLALIYAANALGPPPPSTEAVAIAGLLAAGLIPAGAVLIDRHRATRGA